MTLPLTQTSLLDHFDSDPNQKYVCSRIVYGRLFLLMVPINGHSEPRFACVDVLFDACCMKNSIPSDDENIYLCFGIDKLKLAGHQLFKKLFHFNNRFSRNKQTQSSMIDIV
ncbi:MAG: hypothetical protein NUV45_01810 [Tepidanaerobacteraceae bacterium]|nr:hypothetical protein [Tepidanaerobacteraceae bacterium]